jgi:ABC-type bacteriocin/lantibiotic exporter with double-glycine peptidase domain
MGERGIRLSGGQKQRIGIARALYQNPSILVFDEAMNALDDYTEAEIMDAINLLKESSTIIIITHRLSTVQNCDCVYEIENGHVSYCIAPKINNSV